MVGIPAKTDVFIAGGGPAGLAAAIALRVQGFDVTLADPARPPIDKACGEGLMPGTLAALRGLGVTLPGEHGSPFRGIRFLDGGTSVDASFPNGPGIGIRRTRLHRALVDRATEAGVNLLWGVPVKGLSECGVELDHGNVACRWVIGADGENSRVRRWAGLEGTRRSSLRYGFRRHFRVAPWTDFVEIYWAPGCQIYITPVGSEELSVTVMARDPHLRLEQVRPKFPQLFERLKHAEPTTAERGAVSASRRLARVYRGKVLLAGDASGSVDAITGEGLGLGFEQAVALAKALAGNCPEQYAREHRRLLRRPAFMAALMLSLDRSEWLRRRVLQEFSMEPRLFASHVAMHVGASTASDFVRHSMLPLGLRILIA